MKHPHCDSDEITVNGTDDTARVHLISFGYGHAPAPEAHLTLDMRTHFRDPHVSPKLRHLTARDPIVRDHVLSTPGVRSAIAGAVASVIGMLSGPSPAPVTVAVGCAGGRHRAPSTAIALANALQALGVPVTVEQRDLDREVITR